MKLIENSIDAENLHSSISHGDFDEMASCDIVPVNGEQVQKENSTDKDATVNKLPNGVHKNRTNPSKCNGKMNGYYDDVSDDDFQLVLESSSEDGGSPIKKSQDDSISAPQIVQEIKDLLGINTNGTSIDEELDKELVNLDSAESVELNEKDSGYVNGEVKIPQEIQDVFEEQREDITHKPEESDTLQGEKKVEEKKNSESTECDSSSNLNVVFDEIEIGTDSAGTSGPTSVTKNIVHDTSGDSDEKIPAESGGSQSSLVESTTETSALTKDKIDLDESKTPEKLEEQGKSKVNDDRSVKFVEAETSSSSKEERSDTELPLSQTSNLSASSTEWMVLDSVEASDDEVKSEKLANAISGTDDSSKSEKQEKIEVLVDHHEKMDDSPLTHVSEDGARKRTASTDEEKMENKRPKLEKDENKLDESSSAQVLKRPNYDTEDTETKRAKLGDNKPSSEVLADSSDEVSKTEDCEAPKEIKENNEVNASEQTKTVKSAENGDILKSTVIGNQTKNNDIKEKADLDTSPGAATSNVNNGVDVSVCEAFPGNQSSLDEKEKSTLKSDSMKEVDDEVLLLDNFEGESAISSNTPSSEVSTSDKDLEKKSGKCSSFKDAVKDICMETEDSKESGMSAKSKDTEEVSSSVKDSLNDKQGLKLDSLVGNKEEPLTVEEKSKKNLELVPKVKKDESTVKNKIVLDKKENRETIQIDEGDISKEDMDVPSIVYETKEATLAKKKEKLIEDSVKRVKSPFTMLSKNMLDSKKEPKKLTNLDKAIERVVEKSRSPITLPTLKKFHRDQLKKLTRSQLEEIVATKICESVTDRSEIGQMRLRTQNLEQSIEIWRKKAMQFEKQNRELEMVLKRFMAETAQNKHNSQNKVALPIKVTRSVGLQVVLASSMHGALITSRNRQIEQSKETSKPQSSQQVQAMRPKQIERDTSRDMVKPTTFTPPVQPSDQRRRGRPMRSPQTSSTSSLAATPSTTLQSPTKVTPPTTPLKPSHPTAKTISTPTKDLEVIDLTDREEKAKTSPQNAIVPSGSIRVAPSTQVCFVQQAVATTTAQPMAAYLVQQTATRPGQRPQYLVTTSSPSPPRAINTVSHRLPTSLALPVFRANGQIIPVQTSPQVGVRTTSNTVTPINSRQVPQAIRLQSQVQVLKHPAPLPAPPLTTHKAGSKLPPPRPQLKIAKTNGNHSRPNHSRDKAAGDKPQAGIMLSWSMTLTDNIAEMANYQLYAYQEGNSPPSTHLWKKVGDVKALPLPMACTLTQFIEGHKYHFAVRAVDVHGRVGPFSHPSSILLT